MYCKFCGSIVNEKPYDAMTVQTIIVLLFYTEKGWKKTTSSELVQVK